MKKLYYYHYETDVWVKPIKEFDDDSFFVVKWNERDILNGYTLKKNELLSIFDFLKKYIKGDVCGGVEKTIILNIKNNPSITLKERAEILQIKEGELIEKLLKSQKRGLINLNYSTKGDGVLNDDFIELTKKGESIIPSKKKTPSIAIKPIITLFFVLFFSTAPYSPNINNEVSIEPKTFEMMVENRKNYIETQEFDFDLFIEYLDLVNVKNKTIVLSQAVLETSTFNSDIFKENNNLFGMKQPSIRPTTVIGTNRGHAVYNHWTCSVKDYKLWYEYMTRNNTYNNYFKFLADRGYAEDPYYLPKLKIIEQTILN